MVSEAVQIKGIDDAFVAGFTPEDLISRAMPADVYFRDYELDNFADYADIAEGSWTAPVSLEAVPVPRFPSHALPESLGRYARELSRATQTPQILAAGVALGVASIAIAKKVEVEPRLGWTEPLVLWILNLLPSGERKTAVMKALRKPLDDWELGRRKELSPQIAETESRREILTQRKKDAEKAAAKGGEDAMEVALDLARQLDELEVLSRPQLTTSDTTQEAVAILCAQNGGRIAVWSDEGETMKVIAGRYSKDQSPSVELYLKGHAGGYYSSSRVGRDGISLQDPAIVMVLSIQPEVVRGLGNQRALHGQGYFARFLYALPASALGSRKSRPDPVDEGIREAYHELIKDLLDIEMPKDECGEISPHLVGFSQAADELLEDLQDWIEPQLAPSGNMRAFREWGSKFAGEVVRIAGILHVANQAAIGDEKPWETPIGRPILKRAIEIGLCYLEHSRAAMVEMGADPHITAARHVLDILKKDHQAHISRRDLFNKVRKDSRFGTMKDLDPVVELLKEHGYFRELKPKKRTGPGRPPSTVLEINPLPPGPPPQNPHNPQNRGSGGTKPFFEWLEDRRGPEDPPPSPGSGGPEPEEPGPTPKAPQQTDSSNTNGVWGCDASSVLNEDPNRNGHAPSPEAEPEHEVEKGYELVTDQVQLGEINSEVEATQMIGLDLETTGLCWWRDRIRTLSITTESEKTYVVDAFKVDIKPLVPALKNTKIIAHNALFDLLFLHRMGIEPAVCACTMVLSQILWAGKLKPHSENNVDHDLASVVKRALGEQLDKEKQKADWSGELTSEMLDYAAKDSQVLLPLYHKLMSRIKEAGQMDWVVDIEMRLLKAMVHISDNGLPVDRDKWAEYVQVIIEEKEAHLSAMDALVTQPLPEEFLKRNKKKGDRANKINWQSPEQAAWVIEECHGIALPLTDKGNPSIGKDALKNIDYPLARLLARFNQIKNTAAIFGNALEERYANGRMYGGLKQCEADTGRMSCANPPLQGIPSKGNLRKAVVAPEGYKLVVSDLSQIEIRILAALSEDQTLIRAFEGGADIHRSVAATVLGKNEEDVTDEERKIAKSIVFGQMYGQGVDGLRRNIQNRLGREREFSQAEAQEYWDGFFDAYPGVKRWRKKESRAFDAGSRYTRTLKGRRRLDVDTKPKRWNTPIQGLAADVLKAIAVTVYERREEILSLQMVGLVHDEVILLVLEEHVVRAAKWLTEIMEGVGDSVVNGDRSLEDRVPIKADTSVCKSWGDK